ncbi:MAG TPA: SurA N-terminal domain-containing protein [Terriglobales bacterium]|nr:SurA N-terminal domain-containing protein [Terriglobales bacterium]
MAALVLLMAAAVACKAKPGGDVVATVNGKKILRAELEKYYRNQTAGTPQQPAQPVSDEQSASLRLSILKELIDNEIIMQHAEKLALLATDEEVDDKLKEIKSPYSADEFKKRLQEKGITEEDFKRDLRRSLTAQKVLNKEITSKINVSDKDIESYYNSHKAEFNLIEPQYHLAHIIVTPMPNPQVRNLKNDKANGDAEARKKAQMLINRLDSGEDFSTVAMNYSEDPDSSSNGGDMGFVPESALKGTDPLTRDAVMKLKPGQYSAIIRAVDPRTGQVVGYRIVKLISKEPAGQRDLTDPRVQQAIREQLRDRREQLLKAAYYESIRDQAKVENFFADEVLKNAGAR